MNEKSITAILDLLKAGGILAGVIVTIGIFIVLFKYALPLLIAMRPANGDKNGAGPMFLLLQQAATMPVELGKLTTMIETLMSLVWTKDEVMKQMEANRHDVRNALIAPLDRLAITLENNVKELRRTSRDRRAVPRRPGDRRRKR